MTAGAAPALAGLDHLIVAVADLDEATAVYETLLGRAPSWRGRHPGLGTRNTLFRLSNTYLELLAVDAGATAPFAAGLKQALGERPERPHGIAFGSADIEATVAALRRRGVRIGDAADGAGTDDASGVRRTWRSAFIDPASTRRLFTFAIEHTSPAELLPPAAAKAPADSTCDGIDHIVVFTQDLEASRRLWSETLGVREDWHHDFPERGTRNLGFDLGGIIVELITRTDREPTDRGDTLWGVAYRVADIAAASARLRAAGIEVDEPRAGLLPGTRVATVRWRRTATLLIERRG